ncbi:hypothetical protein [Laceyella putida]|uniref:Peptidase M10 metallopeptidase domain-containing protein n=1 Tax=Laceyella putida TaxID=110101 RepID=A0ABW2RLF1_9BACL
MIRKISFLTVAVTLLSVWVLSTGVSAHPWGGGTYGYHWNRYGTPTIGIYNTSTSGRYYNTSEAARADWDSKTILSLPNRSYHTDVHVFNANSGATGWAGLASIESWENSSLGHIGHAHAQANNYYTDSYSDNDLRGVYCQEIGHAFGLDHSNTGDCMGAGYYNNAYTVGSHNVSDIYNTYSTNHHGSLSKNTAAPVDSTAPTAIAVWANQPQTMNELKALSNVIAFGKVTKIEKGQDIVHNLKGESEAYRIPTQIITFEITKSMKGLKAGQQVKVFKTGDNNFRIAEDPSYEVGKDYLLFLQKRPGNDQYLVVAPEGRYSVVSGKLEAATSKKLGKKYKGFTTQSMIQEIQSAK